MSLQTNKQIRQQFAVRPTKIGSRSLVGIPRSEENRRATAAAANAGVRNIEAEAARKAEEAEAARKAEKAEAARKAEKAEAARKAEKAEAARKKAEEAAINETHNAEWARKWEIQQELAKKMPARAKAAGKELLDACEEKNSEKALRILGENPGKDTIDVNFGDGASGTPLTRAAEYGLIDVVRALLQRPDINVNSVDYNYRTSLGRACGKGHTEIVNLLLDHKDIDVNIATKSQGYGSRHTAIDSCSYRFQDIRKRLIEKGARSSDTPDILGFKIMATINAMIQFNSDAGEEEVLAMIKYGNPDVNFYNSDYTLLSAAATNGFINIVRALLATGKIYYRDIREARLAIQTMYMDEPKKIEKIGEKIKEIKKMLEDAMIVKRGGKRSRTQRKCRLVVGKRETCCIKPKKGHWCWSKGTKRRISRKMKRNCCR